MANNEADAHNRFIMRNDVESTSIAIAFLHIVVGVFPRLRSTYVDVYLTEACAMPKAPAHSIAAGSSWA